MSISFNFDWGFGGDISDPELRSTWGSLEIRINGDIVTTCLEDSGGPRTRIHVPAVTLAEWMTENWFTILNLQAGSTSSASESNLLAAADGFTWPDLEFSAEGAIIHCTWRSGRHTPHSSLRFISSGDAWLTIDELRDAMTQFIETTLDRLRQSGLNKSTLKQKWEELQGLDKEEREFCQAAGHLGLYPFDVDPSIADALISASEALDHNVFIELLDSTDPAHLNDALAWVRRVHALSPPSRHSVHPVELLPKFDRPWELGYAMADRFRKEINRDNSKIERFPIEEFASTVVHEGRAGGVNAFARMNDTFGTRVIFPTQLSESGERFASARALGAWYMFKRGESLLPATHTQEDRATRAFAAELLAPQSFVQSFAENGPLGVSGQDALAVRLGVSRDVIQRQKENFRTNRSARD